MKNIVFVFQSHQELWAFKQESKTVNVQVRPRENRMAGPFPESEVERAREVYRASVLDNSPAHTPTRY